MAYKVNAGRKSGWMKVMPAPADQREGKNMSLIRRWQESQVSNAINVLNTTRSRIVARGALKKLLKHPEASPSAISSLLDLAVKHPDPAFREKAESGLRKIAHTHKDPALKERAGKALKELAYISSCSCHRDKG